MNILVVSPHPDDETLGAGGSLQRLKAEGNTLFWLNITDLSEELGYTPRQMEERTGQINKIRNFYGFSDFLNLKLLPTRLDHYESGEIIGKISAFVDGISAEWIFLPDYNDAHSDHKRVFDWCIACTKVFRHPSVKRIMTMEILSETNFGRPESPFVPDFYFDVSGYMDKKMDALKIYESELGEHPFPRSLEAVKALGTLRGSEGGGIYAEAFRIIKIIE